MKKQASILLEKSVDSLLIAVEHVNRPWDRGRKEAVLILKAASLQRRGRR